MRTATRHARAALVVAIVTAVTVALDGCADSTADHGGPDPAIRGQWELLAAWDASGRIALANQLITLTIKGDSSTNGRSTCTDYSARILGPSADLWVTTKLPHNERFCISAQSKIQKRYIAALDQVRSARVSGDGGILDLEAPHIELEFQRALVIPLNLIVGHSWSLSSVSPDAYTQPADPPIVPTSGANLYFGSNGVLTGSTGCRQFTGKYVENAGELVVEHLDIHNNFPCSNAQIAVDNDTMGVIETGFTFLSRTHELELASPRVQLELTFVD